MRSLKGSHNELSIIADELRHSIKSIVSYATDDDARTYKRQPPPVSLHADEILQLIAHERFCRAIIEASPSTAGAVFEEIRETKKYSARGIKQFAKNIVTEAISYKDSFLYHEVGVYENSFIGLNRPLSQTLFSRLRNGIGHPHTYCSVCPLGECKVGCIKIGSLLQSGTDSF